MNKQKEKGSVLIIVLSVIIAITLLVVGVIMFLNSNSSNNLTNTEDGQIKELVVENSVPNSNNKIAPTNLVSSDPKCNQLNIEKEREYCYADIAEEKQDIKICDSLVGKETKDYCYGGIRNYVACSKITSSFSKNLCYSNIVLYKNINDSLVRADCDNIDVTAVKDYCYSNLAVLNKQYDICTLISKDGNEGDTISKCKFNVAVARNECETLAMPIRDLCYSGVALLSKDKNKCSLIQDPETRNLCELSVEY